MIRDEDRPVADPPPLPASHPTQKDRWREGLRIPLQFYFEAIVAQLLLVMVVYAAQRLIPMLAGVALFGQPFLWFWLVWRLAKRVMEAREKRGKPRPEATAVFVAALVIPMALLLGGAFLLANQRRQSQRTDEAKVLLGGIYRAERAFHKDFSRYTLSVTELSSFRPPADSQPFYQVGFATVCAVKAGVAKEKAQWPVDDPAHLRDRRTDLEAGFLAVRAEADCRDLHDGFEAFAVGVPRDGGPLDIWQIDERGQLRNRESN